MGRAASLVEGGEDFVNLKVAPQSHPLRETPILQHPPRKKSSLIIHALRCSCHVIVSKKFI